MATFVLYTMHIRRKSMNDFFSPDKPLNCYLAKFCDLILLNFIFILSCIPIFTIGASITALYSITFQMLKDNNSNILKRYLSAFKVNFKQASIIWIPILLIFIFFSADLYVIYALIDPSYRILQYPVWFIIIILYCITMYIFPLLSCFNCSNKLLIKNAIFMSIGHFPTTFIFLIVNVIIFSMCISIPNFIVFVLSIALFFGFSSLAYAYSFLFRNIFKKHMNEPLV